MKKCLIFVLACLFSAPVLASDVSDFRSETLAQLQRLQSLLSKNPMKSCRFVFKDDSVQVLGPKSEILLNGKVGPTPAQDDFQLTTVSSVATAFGPFASEITINQILDKDINFTASVIFDFDADTGKLLSASFIRRASRRYPLDVRPFYTNVFSGEHIDCLN